MKVFLSSTYLDLIEHRKAVIHGLRTMGEEVEHMEIFGARNEEPTRASLEELVECDVLVGIYAYRYGSVPKESKTSVTEQEYLHATSKKIAILVFVVNGDHDWPPKKMDESLTKIKKFKAKAPSEHTPAYFTTPDNLATQVVAAVGKLAKKPKVKKGRKSSAKSLGRKTLTKEVVKGVRADVRGSTLPHQPYFFGREKELATIADAISPESRTWGALIDGPGGIGKTALAIRAADLAPTTLFDRKIFITGKVRELTPEGEKPLKDFSHDNYFSMLNELALELGEEGIPRLAPDERANPLRMAMAGKKTLIVFDNLETLSEDERTRLFQFLSRLPQGNKAIVTSRRRADVDARVIRLDRLSADESLQLMEELAKNNKRLTREDKEARRDLYEITNGNPLLMKWVCGQLGREGSALHTLTDAYDFIKNAPEGNDPLEYIFGDLLEAFKPNETIVLAALTHFAQPAKPRWIADMTGLAEKATETVLEDLADRSIIMSSAETREFYLPTLAAQFIRTRRNEKVIEIGNHLGDMVYTLVVNKNPDRHRKISTLEDNWVLISAGLLPLAIGNSSYLQELCDEFLSVLDFTSHLDEYLWLRQQVERRALEDNDRVNAGWQAYHQIDIHILQREFTKAQGCIKRARNYWKDSKDNHLLAILLYMKFQILENSGKYSAAKKTLEKALTFWRADSNYGAFLAFGLSSLAGLQRKTKDYQPALINYSDAAEISLKNNNLLTLTSSMNGLAKLFIDLEEWSKAEFFAKRALKVSEESGELLSASISCDIVTKALLRQGHPRKALRYARRSLDLVSNYRKLDLDESRSLLAECENAIQVQKTQKSASVSKSK